MLAGTPKCITNKLQRVLNGAAHIVTSTSKYDRGLSHRLHAELHWIDVPRRVQYRLCTTAHRCLRNEAPQYLVDGCTPVSDTASRQHLRSTSCHQLFVPRHQRSMFGVGPSLLPVRRPGTRCQTVYETWHVLSTAYSLISKLFFYQSTSKRRALET